MDKILISEISKIKQVMGIQILNESSTGGIGSLLKTLIQSLSANKNTIETLMEDLIGGIITAQGRNDLKLFLKTPEGDNLYKNLMAAAKNKKNSLAERTLALSELKMFRKLIDEVGPKPYGEIGSGVAVTSSVKETVNQTLSNLRTYYPEFKLFETKIDNLFPNVSEKIKNDILLSFKTHMHKDNKQLRDLVTSEKFEAVYSKMGAVGKVLKLIVNNKMKTIGIVGFMAIIAIVTIFSKSGIIIASDKSKDLEDFFGASGGPTESEFKEWFIGRYPQSGAQTLKTAKITITGKLVTVTVNNKTITFKKLGNEEFEQVK
jgi:hypothetical protein